MPQSQSGKQKAAATKRQKYGDDYFKKIGSIGGKAKHTKPKGFSTLSPEDMREISRKGHQAKREKRETDQI